LKSLDRKLERPETFVSNVRTKPMQQKIKLEEVFLVEVDSSARFIRNRARRTRTQTRANAQHARGRQRARMSERDNLRVSNQRRLLTRWEIVHHCYLFINLAFLSWATERLTPAGKVTN
jgi:hypothetical protein